MALRTYSLKAATVSISLIILILGVHANSYGASRYVDKAANGANNGSSWANAWESFADINWGSISPGDTLYISGGSNSKIYYETLDVNVSGTSSGIITIRGGTDSNHNGKVIIDGQDSRSYAIDLKDADYVYVRYLTAKRGEKYDIRLENCDYVTVDHVTVPDAQDKAIRMQDSRHITFSNLAIDTSSYYDEQSDGIYIQDSSYVTIDSCTLRVENNNPRPHDDNIQLVRVDNWTVKNNRLIVNSTANENKQNLWAEGSDGTNYVYNNHFERHTNNGWGQMIGFDNNSISGNGTIHIYNNTLKSTTNTSNLLWIKGGNASGHIVKNNIFWKTAGSACLGMIEGGLTPANFENNLYYNPESSCIMNVNSNDRSWSQWTSQGFDDNNGLNTHPSLGGDLKPNSDNDPSVDAGTTVGFFSTDRTGVYRPQGSAWDIGAYEHDNGSSDPGPDQPNPPTNLRIIN